MRRTAALAVIAALSAGCGSRQHAPLNRLIVLDRSIGGISLREPREQVERVLGHGRHAGSTANDPFVYKGAGIDVWYAPPPRAFVIAIRTTSSHFHTRGGVRVGSPISDVRSIRGTLCYAELDCQHGYDDDGPGTTFRLTHARGRVAWIALAFGH